MVAREEVAGLVLEWLRRENLLDTAAALSREAATLLDRLTKPENRRVRDLTALLNAHVLLLQKKKQKRDLKQSFLLRYPEILPQTFHAFLRLLDDYQLMTSSVPTTSTSTTTATFPHAASLSSSPLSSLPLSPPGSVPRSPGGFYAPPTHSRPPESPRSTGEAAAAASAGAIGSGRPPGRQPLVPQVPKHLADAPQRRGRGRKPAVPPPPAALLSALAAQRTLAPIPSPLMLSTPMVTPAAPMPLTFARPQLPVVRPPLATPAPTSTPTTSNGLQQLPTAGASALPTSLPRTRPQPTPTPAMATMTTSMAATTTTTTTVAAAVVAPSPLTSPPPAPVTFAAPVAPTPTAKAPAPSSSSSSLSTTSSSPPAPSSSASAAALATTEAFAAPLPLSTSSSPSKRKRQTPRKRKIEAVATEVIGHSSKAPRTSAHPTPSTSTSSTTTVTITAASAADTQLESAEALFAAGGEEMMVLDDSFFEMLLRSDLPEKLAEQINRNLRSEAEQQQQQQQEREQARLAREAEAAALAAQEPTKTIEEIVEAITHGPAFEALLSQWDAEILDDEGEGEGEAVVSDQYEEIIDEYDDELSISDDDDDDDDDAGTGDDNQHKGDQGGDGDAAATTAAAEEEEDHGGKVIAEEEDDEEEAGAPSPTMAPSSGGRERVATAEKLQSLDLDAFLNTIHGPKQ